MILVLDMMDRRPAWAMREWVPDRIGRALDEHAGGGEVRVMDVPADGSGDGVARPHPEVLRAVEDADAYLGYGIPAEVLRRGERLRWVHSGAAGVGGSLTAEMRNSKDVVFTNSAGIHGPPMAETVLGMILHFFRGFDFAVSAQARREWDTGPFYQAGSPLRELSRSTVGVVGFGGVGREVARRAAALGADVLGVRRTGGGVEEVPLAPVESSGGANRPRDAGGPARTVGTVGTATVFAGPEALRRVARECDVLVLTAPETEETRGMIDAGILALMRPSAVLINVARGGLVVEEDLVEALVDGRLRGAALDVFGEEPLAPDDPLRDAPNLLVTPHVSAVTDAYWERETTLIVKNVVRLAEGRTLLNVVDREVGY